MPEYITISKEIEFDAGHRVPNHKSKCRNPHGHRYRVRVYAIGPIVEESGAPDEGMLVDFSDLKAIMQTKIHDVLDHGFIVYHEDEQMIEALYGFDPDDPTMATPSHNWKVIVFPYIPTAENIARWCWEQIKNPIEKSFRSGLVLNAVTVYETPTSEATYNG